ncbi:MAG: nitroreductase family protein [Methyloceanibacter sp.]
MDVTDAMYGRRAVRDYTSDPVDESVLRQLIKAAVQAPSAVNRQPWTFTVVRDQVLLSQISEKSKFYLLSSSLEQGAMDRYRELLADPNFQIFYHAPVLIVISAKEPSLWAVEDCSVAAQNLMLAAYAAGLGTCWIGFAKHWLGTPEGKAALKLGPECVVVAPIIVGHPKIAAAPVPRKEPDVQWVG